MSTYPEVSTYPPLPWSLRASVVARSMVRRFVVKRLMYPFLLVACHLATDKGQDKQRGEGKG